MAYLGKNMGHSASNAARLTKNIAMMSKKARMSAGQFAKGMAGSLKTLAVYGEQTAVKVFTNLATAASTAGVEVGKLLDLAGKFDTFESAATTVGKLNALMGTQLNATDMLLKTEDERIETLIATVQGTGKAFADMNRFEQKAIASAAGITDMNEAQKIFGMNLGQYGQYSKEQDIAASTQAELNERMRKATPIFTKVKMMLLELTIAVGDYIEPISDGITKMHELVKEHKAWLQPLATSLMVIASLVLAFKSLMFVFKLFGLTFLPKMIAGFFGLAGAQSADAAATFAATKAKSKAMRKMARAGAYAAQTLAGGVSTAIGTITGAVAASFSAIASGIIAAGGIMLGAVPATLIFVGVLLAMGIAAMLVGAGFLMMGAGALMLAGAMPALLVGMVAFTIMVGVLSVFGAVAAIQIGMIAIAMTGLAMALYALPVSPLAHLAAFAKGMAEMDDMNAKATFEAASTFVSDLSQNSANLKPMLQNIALMTTGVSAESGALGLLGAAIIGVGNKIDETAKAGKEMVVKLDGEATTKLMRGEAVKVQVGTGLGSIG